LRPLARLGARLAESRPTRTTLVSAFSFKAVFPSLALAGDSLFHSTKLNK
jgi:hypothetical protein